MAGKCPSSGGVGRGVDVNVHAALEGEGSGNTSNDDCARGIGANGGCQGVEVRLFEWRLANTMTSRRKLTYENACPSHFEYLALGTNWPKWLRHLWNGGP